MKDYDFKADITRQINDDLQRKSVSKSLLSKLDNLVKEFDFENIYTSFEVCPDNYIGKINGEKFISAENRYKAYINGEKNLTYGKDNEENIVVILESPHKDEYRKKLIAPALGETGDRLNAYLEKLLTNSLIARDGAQLFLINAIQYQCSLGFPTDCVRSYIFNYLFDQDKFKKDLKERIDIQNPKTIVIATTSFCRDKIKKWILNEYKDIPIYETDSHPSVWTMNTKIKECN